MTDQDSFEEFVTARRPALTRSAYLLTGDHHEAEDLVQRALVKAVGVWSRIRDRPEPYVRRIMYHDNISRWRRRRPQEWLTDRVPDSAVADPDPTVRLGLQQALMRLTPKQRTVLVLRYYEDLTEVETAAVLDIAVGTVKSQCRHALMRIRQLSPDLEAMVASGS